MNTVSVKGTEWRVLRDGDQWVAICDELKLTTWDDSYEEMLESISDILGHLGHNGIDGGATR